MVQLVEAPQAEAPTSGNEPEEENTISSEENSTSKSMKNSNEGNSNGSNNNNNGSLRVPGITTTAATGGSSSRSSDSEFSATPEPDISVLSSDPDLLSPHENEAIVRRSPGGGRSPTIPEENEDEVTDGNSTSKTSTEAPVSSSTSGGGYNFVNRKNGFGIITRKSASFVIPGSSPNSTSRLPPPSAASGASDSSANAPSTRRRGLSKLRRRLSQTLRMSFHGSLSELASNSATFSIAEEGEDGSVSSSGYNSAAVNLSSMPNSETESRFLSNQRYRMTPGNGSSNEYQLSHTAEPTRRASFSFPSKFRSISNLTRKLSGSNSRIISLGDSFSSLNARNGVVHENSAIGSDGESEAGSRHSEVSPAGHPSLAPSGGVYGGVRMRQKHNQNHYNNHLQPGGQAGGPGGQVAMDPATQRKLSSQEEINKRLSLPADLKLPDNFVEKMAVSPTLDGPLSRATRRQSLSEIGFGRMDTYTKLDKLGEGTYATVFKGKSKLTDNLVALKEIRLEHEEGAPCTAIREVSLLKDLKHNNIVTLHDIVHTEKSLTLVFEYLERDLKQYMDDCGGILAMNNVKIFLFQLVRGLAYCHSRRILHRDLKPQNLLINEIGELKLADFGLARAKSVPTKTYSNEVVTLWYRPPDVLLGSTEYSTPIDMWGVGCIFFEMASGRPLFPGSTVEDELHLIFKVLGSPTEETWRGISMSEELLSYNFPEYPAEPLVKRAPRLDAEGIDLLTQFLRFEARQRTSAKESMRHPYFMNLGPGVHGLKDTHSLFSVPGINLSKDPGYRTSAYTSTGKSRRQSMLL